MRQKENTMCESCMHLEYDDRIKEYVCSIEMIIDEDDLARMAYQPRKRCPYYKLGDEYTLVRKQN